MSLSPEHTRDETETSCFGFLSPPSDAEDVPSAEGYALQGQLTDLDQEPHSREEYSQSEGSPTGGLYSSFVPAEQADTSPHGATPHLLDPYTFSALSSLPPLSVPSLPTLQPDVPQHHLFHSSTSVPPPALDLANASLEMTFADNHYDGYNTYSLHPDASPFMQHNQSFDMVAMNDFSNLSDPAASSPSNFLSPLPSVSLHNLSSSTVCSTESFDLPQTLSPSALHRPDFPRAYASDDPLFTRGRLYSPRFSVEHKLNLFFVRTYLLGDELGAGGYGFVMTARHRTEGNEVAVKFIIKTKVPDHAWVDDGYGGRVPSEVMLLGGLEHPNIVKCFELYEDEIYYYMVQELHGTPWVSKKDKRVKQPSAPGALSAPSVSSPPLLTPSLSTDSMLDSVPSTPSMSAESLRDLPAVSISLQSSASPEQGSALFFPSHAQHPSAPAAHEVGKEKCEGGAEAQGLLRPPLPLPLQVRPNFTRRPSHDLFECIEQSKYKRLSENQARYIFAQVVEAVYYLDSKGITHCDIKDENLLVDSDLKVKLIDFGSAVWVDDPSVPRPYYHQFYGTTAYASSEILRKMPYRAPPAETWTLGVLLSYLLTGHSPFPTEQDAMDGRITLRELGSARISRAAISLMQRCLERDPDRRADIVEVRGHRWLAGALERDGLDQ